MKALLITAIAFMALLTMGCMEDKSVKEVNQLQGIPPSNPSFLLLPQGIACNQKVMRVNKEIRQQMFAHVEQWQQSNLNQTQYCRQYNIAYSAFHYWYKRFRLSKTPQAAGGFVPLQMLPAVEHVHTELVLADGRRIVFHQPVSADYLKVLIG